MIEFLCPNGHKIRCQPEQAGRAAKCPRCGVRFRIPDRADLELLNPVGSDSGVLGPEFTDSVVSSQKFPSLGGAVKESEIEFLCPNGHHLHGAASLQGKPGECPECGSRFRIPSYEDISADEVAERNLGIGRINDLGISLLGDWDAGEARSALSAGNRRPREDMPSPSVISSRSVPGQGMAALVARLWDLRTKDATLELRLRDGETIIPHQFLKKLSQQSRQGVFAVKETDDSLSLTVVAWDAIARATLRGLNELPKGLGE